MNVSTMIKKCARCGKEFESPRSEQRKYCSIKCGSYGRWEEMHRQNKSGKWVNLNELRRLYEEEDLTVVQIAQKVKLDPSTIYKRLKKYGICTRKGTRLVSVSQGKVSFVISVSPIHSVELEMTLKAIKKQTPFPFSLKCYDKTYRETIKDVREMKRLTEK